MPRAGNDTVTVTVLAENTTRKRNLLAEHGLAYLLEWGERRILFDTGQGNVLLYNAWKQEVPLDGLEAIVLSHGHYDHTGGLADALRNQLLVTVYMHPDCTKSRYSKRNNEVREIGMPAASKAALEKSNVKSTLTESATTIAGPITATGPIPRVTDFEQPDECFFVDAQCTEPDLLNDDQALFFETPRGTVVLLGCAHAGLINTLRYVQELTGGNPIVAVIGGTHLTNASEERLQKTLEELSRHKLQLLAPGHCTGIRATAAFWQRFGQVCRECSVGERFSFSLNDE